MNLLKIHSEICIAFQGTDKRLWRSEISAMQLKIHSVVISNQSIHDKLSPSPEAIVIWLSRPEIAKIYPDNPVYPVHIKKIKIESIPIKVLTIKSQREIISL